MQQTILYVEDIKKLQVTTTKILKEYGFRTICASNKADAMKIFNRQSSEINAVISDCRLEDSDESNRDGLDVAKFVKTRDPEMPVIGVSAYKNFSDQADHFDLYFEKNETEPEKDFFSNIHKISELIEIQSSNCLDLIPEQLLNLKSKYQINDRDFRMLASNRTLTPSIERALLALHKSSDDVFDKNSAKSSDEIIPIQHTKIISPESIEGKFVELKNPFIVVITVFRDYSMVELYGFQMIYTYGDSINESINEMMILLKEYFDELNSDDTTENSVDVIKFNSYLKELFIG